MKAIESKSFLHDCYLKDELKADLTSYPLNILAIASLKRIEFDPRITFFVGENGSGKSTLLEALAVHLGLNPEGGSRNFNFSTRESHSDLHKYLRVCKGVRKPKDLYFLRSESFFNVATEIERLDGGHIGKIILSYGGTSLHEQSHGESFLAFLQNRVGTGLYLFDEPEAALSPTRQLSLLKILHDRISLGAQFVIATHSPILLGYPGATIYNFSSEGIAPIQYRQTEHFVVTSQFLNSPDKMLKILFDKNVDQDEEAT